MSEGDANARHSGKRTESAVIAGPRRRALSAEVVRIEVTSRTDLAGGQGSAAGAYEKIAGKIFFAVDPALQ